MVDRLSSAKAVAFPVSIFGRLDAERGFARLQRSVDELASALVAEIERLAVTGWGSKPARVAFAIDAIGHVPSRVDPSLIHVLYVRPLSGMQPVRAVVTVPLADYGRFACNPFLFARAGFFGVVDAFIASIANTDTASLCAPACGPTGVEDVPPAGQGEWSDEGLAAAIAPLMRGESRILRAPFASEAILNLVEEIAWAMPIKLRSRTTILSYAFTDPRTLDGLAPALVCVHDDRADAPKRNSYGQPDAEALTAILAAREARRAPPADASADDKLVRLSDRVADLECRLYELEAPPSQPAVDGELASDLSDDESEGVGNATPGEPTTMGRHVRPERLSRRSLLWLLGSLVVASMVGVVATVTAVLPLLGTDPALREYVGMAGETQPPHTGSLTETLGQLERQIGSGASGDGALAGRVDALKRQVVAVTASLGDDSVPGSISKQLKELETKLAGLEAQLGRPTEPGPDTVAGRVSQMGKTIRSTETTIDAQVVELEGVKAVLTSYSTALGALLDPLRELPGSGSAYGNEVKLSWTTDARSGAVTIAAAKSGASGRGAPGGRVSIAALDAAGVQLADSGNRGELRLLAPSAPSVPLQLSRVRVSVGSPGEVLSLLVAIMAKPGASDAGVIRILGIAASGTTR